MIRPALLCLLIAMLAAEDPVRVTVITPPTIAPGIGGEVVVRFALAPGWHLYWSNPGDSGLPPRLTWTLPEGWTIGEPRFPAPERHVDAGMVTWVHHGVLELVQRLVPPADAAAGRHELRLEASWLVCRDQCLPGQNALTAVVQVGAGADPGAAVAAARSALPVPAAELGLVITAATEGGQVRLTVAGASAPARRWPVAPAAEGVFNPEHPAAAPAADGWTISLSPVAGAALPARFIGVLWDGDRAAAVDIPIQAANP